jgi:DNA-binding response OmpR family regulator
VPLCRAWFTADLGGTGRRLRHGAMRHAVAVSIARPHVLIIEDEAGVRQALERGLTRGGFDTTAVSIGREALCVNHHDIALVDLGLPDGDGVELCRELRARHPERPIIVVTGRNDELDVVDALDAGADDYVTKPFSLAVLTLRMRRHLDRSSSVVEVGSLRLDCRARLATLAGEPLDLTAREFDLLSVLALRAGDAVDKKELMATVWDAHWSKSTHTLPVHISSLRTKLIGAGSGSPTIASVPGIGYRLEAAPSNR